MSDTIRLQEGSKTAFDARQFDQSTRLTAFENYVRNAPNMTMGRAMFEPISEGNDNLIIAERHMIDDFWLSKVETSGYRISIREQWPKAESLPNKVTVCQIREGEVELRSAKQTHRLSAGDIYLLETLQYQTTFGRGKTAKIMLPADYFRDVLRDPRTEAGEIAILPKHNPINPIISATITAIEELTKDPPRVEHQRLAVTTRELIYGVLASGFHKAEKTRYELIRERARAYVSANLKEPDLDVASIASHAGASRATLYRALEHDGGVREMINDLRINSARKLLRTKMPRHGLIQDVASYCGFRTTRQLQRSFKKKFGITPNAFNHKYFGQK